MLREELKDEDIPHRTTVRRHILEVWDDHLDQLAAEMQVDMFCIYLDIEIRCSCSI
jgi:hypothetical protein